MEWVKKEDYKPSRSGERVLAFSPDYVNDDPMRFRTMDSQFLKICSDVTHVAVLEEPND